jgi:hypothetical protein
MDEQDNSMKVGALVEFRGYHGLILEIGEGDRDGQVFVGWFGLSPEWDNPKILKVINESR